MSELKIAMKGIVNKQISDRGKLNVSKICRELENMGFTVSRKEVVKFCKDDYSMYLSHRFSVDFQKLNTIVKEILSEDDAQSLTNVHKKVLDKGFTVSLSYLCNFMNKNYPAYVNYPSLENFIKDRRFTRHGVRRLIS